MESELAIGVDIGGTKIAFAAVSPDGHVHASYRLPTPVPEGPDAVFQQVGAGVDYLLNKLQTSISGIGIGSPGHLNPHTGLIYKATNLYWTNVNLLEGVRRYLPDNIPILLQKDGNAAAYGELHFGAAQGFTDFILITIGTGLGGGAFSGGQIVEGADYSGMEIGHMPLDPNGRTCICGMNGCPEMYVSGVGILAGANEYLSLYPSSILNKPSEVTTEDVLHAFAQGDPLASRLIDESTDWLTSVMLACMGILNPGLFVIGGGLGHALFETLAREVKQKLRQRTRREIHREVPMMASQVSHSAIGPASLVWHRLGKEG